MRPLEARHAMPTGRATRLARALGALIALAAVVAGLPALMNALGLVPHAVPTWRQIGGALTERDTGQLLVVILAGLIWLCWALFTLSLVVEIFAAMRHRPARLLPGLAIFQQASGALVAAIVIGLTLAPTIGGAAVPLTAPHAATQAFVPDPHAHPRDARPSANTVMAATANVATGPSYRSQPRDTLWGIAEQTLGEPLRYNEIKALNRDRIGPDNEIEPGTILTLPADAKVSHPTGDAGPVTVTVKPGDILSAITEQITGDADLYPAVAAANHLPDPDDIVPGQVIVIPADLIPDRQPSPGSDVTVKPHDTLSEITEAATGHADDLPAVWAANQGRPEPGGATLDDEDLIYPGWIITIPAGLTPPAPEPSAPAAPPTRNRPADTHKPGEAAGQHPPSPADHQDPAAPPTSTSAPSTTAHAPRDADTAPPTPSVHAGLAPTTQAAPPLPDETITPPTGQPAPGTALGRPAAADPSPDGVVASPSPSASDSSSWSAAAVFAGGGGLLLGGVTLAALKAYRHGQFRRRRPGRMIATSPPELIGMERAVIGAGRDAIASIALLDHALRGLAQTAAQRDDRMPDIIAACLTAQGLTLVLATPDTDPPQPWRAERDGTRWTIGRDDPTNYRDDRREYGLAPYPALVSVGHTDDREQWLLDLERIGTLCLTGDPERSLDLMRFAVAELAHNTWSEMLSVTMVGFGEELVSANPDRLHTADIDTATASATSRLDDGDEPGVLSGRAGPTADAWAPHIILVNGEHPERPTAISDLCSTITARDDRSCVAVVCANHPDAAAQSRWTLRVDADGALSIPALDLRLKAQQLPHSESAQLAQMLAVAAEADDTPNPPSHGSQPWDRGTNAAGARTQTAGAGTTPRIPLHLADDHPRGNSLLPLPDENYRNAAAVVSDELEALAPIVDPEIRDHVETTDPGLDADLADWADRDCPRPRITVLGTPTVRAAGALPTRSPQLRVNTEAVVYLATRGPDGVLSTVFAETMWPGDPTVAGKSKVKNTISVLRGWLGHDPVTGLDYLPDGRHDPGPARYHIRAALIDAELFRRLRRRGMARGAAGIADLTRALALIAGPPFDGITERRRHDDPGPGGWLWMTQANARLDLEYTGMIVDTAHTVATHHLAADRPDQAAAAIKSGMLAGTYDDILLLDLIRACQAEGHDGEAASWAAQLRASYDGNDLPERTAQILHTLENAPRRGLRARAS